MSAKGFFLLVVTVIVIGGSIGGAFSGGLALGRSQNGDAAPETALLQQRFGGGQPSSGGFTPGGFPGGQLSGVASDREFQTGQNALSRDGEGTILGGGNRTSEDGFSGIRGEDFGGRGGFGGILGGAVGAVDGNVFTVTTDSGETQVRLDEDSIIQITHVGTADDLSPGDQVMVIATGDVASGEPVAAASVIVNSPEVGRLGDGGLGGVLNGIIATVDGNVFTVTTDSGEATVTLGEDTAIQVYEVGTVDDLSSGDRVLVVLSADVEAGDSVVATSVIVSGPTQGGFFGRGGFGGSRINYERPAPHRPILPTKTYPRRPIPQASGRSPACPASAVLYLRS